MGDGADLTTDEKQKIPKFLCEGMSTLEISKELCRDNQMIKTAVENVIKLPTQNKGTCFLEMNVK